MTGRPATAATLPGRGVLSVGDPRTPLPTGWRWVQLTDVARLESGHTPSRRHPEFWGGGIPWIGIRDAREHHAGEIFQTEQTVSQLGLDNSAARLLPAGTVCLSRTASIGYVVVLGIPMATSQDFVNWVCSEALEPRYLLYALLHEGREGLAKFGEGTVHTTIYFPTVKAFHLALPPRAEQRRIVTVIEDILAGVQRVRASMAGIPEDVAHVERTLLAAAMTGRLTQAWRSEAQAPVLAEPPPEDVVSGLPAGWRVVRLAEVITGFAAGRSPRTEGRPARGSEYGVLKVSAVTWGRFDPAENKAMLPGDVPEAGSTVRADDVLISRANTAELVGAVVHVDTDHPRLMLSDKTLRICYRNDLVAPRFLVSALRTRAVRSYFERHATGTSASMRNLSQDKIAGVSIALPPLTEQHRIASLLDEAGSKLAALHRISAGLQSDLDAVVRAVLAKAFRGELTRPAAADEAVADVLARLAASGMDAQNAAPEDPRSAKGRTRMKRKKIDQEALRSAIADMPGDTFSFADLRKRVPGDYEELRDLLFDLLEQPAPPLRQFFDRSSGAVRFMRCEQ